MHVRYKTQKCTYMQQFYNIFYFLCFCGGIERPILFSLSKVKNKLNFSINSREKALIQTCSDTTFHILYKRKKRQNSQKVRRKAVICKLKTVYTESIDLSIKFETKIEGNLTIGILVGFFIFIQQTMYGFQLCPINNVMVISLTFENY